MGKKKKIQRHAERNVVVEALEEGKVARQIHDVPADQFLHNVYLPYSFYVIKNRALVSADGLKPVHKRILYDMYTSRILYNRPHVKTSRIGGNVMGKYHPHGEGSITSAMARLGQWFSMRVPLIDPYGSVGHQTGDTPAAPRYWEARLTRAAQELVKDIDDNALPMSRNFDDTMDEPAMLPVRWPSALINGTEGIAVGYASKVFPHNPTEVMDAIIAYMNNPEITLDEIMEIMPAPDFPTGGEILPTADIKKMYETGEGRFKVRGKYYVEEASRGRSIIVFYELPYQVAPGDIVKKVRSAQKDKNDFSEISEIKDLSDKTNGLYLQIKLKSGSNPDLVVEKLYKDTTLETSFSSNQTVLQDGIPTKSSLFEIFEQFLNLRMLCVTNTLESKVKKISHEIYRNEGLQKALIDIDKAIAIIRQSDTDVIACENLMKEFDIEEEQAQFVLSFRLRQLVKVEQNELIDKIKSLREERDRLQFILDDEPTFLQYLTDELEETKKIIADERRTEIGLSESQIKERAKQLKAEKAAIEKNGLELRILADGSVVKAAKGSQEDTGDILMPTKGYLPFKQTDTLYALLRNGEGTRVPTTHFNFNGISTRKSLELDYVGFGKQESGRSDLGLLVVTTTGRVAILNGKYPVTAKTFPVITLDEGEEVFSSEWLTKADKDKLLMIASSNGLVTSFPISSIRVSNPGVKPIKGMAIEDGQRVVGASIVEDEGIVVTMTNTSVKVTNLAEFPPKNRDTKGIIAQRITASTGPVIKMIAGKRDEIFVYDEFTGEFELPADSTRARNGVNFPTAGLYLGYKSPEVEEESTEVEE